MLFEEARGLSQEFGNDLLSLAVNLDLYGLALAQGREQQAALYYVDSDALIEKLKSETYKRYPPTFLVILKNNMDRRQISVIEHYLKTAREKDNVLLELEALDDLALAFIGQPQGIQYRQEYLSIAKRLGTTELLINAYEMLGLTYQASGEFRRAWEAFREAVTTSEMAKLPVSDSLALNLIASAFRKPNNEIDAIEEAYNLASQVDPNEVAAFNLRLSLAPLIVSSIILGQHDEAEEYVHIAIKYGLLTEEISTHISLAASSGLLSEDRGYAMRYLRLLLRVLENLHDPCDGCQRIEELISELGRTQ